MDCDPKPKKKKIQFSSIYTILKSIVDPKLKTVVLWNTKEDI